ncbi:MAG: glycosyltransferase family 39 protein [Pirellulales bacterium]|nr:glycosyltransferase family 39 protein [Pirellulales bacterium]
MTSVIRVPLLLLLGAVLLRGFLLGYTDLLDPTETRYASVAQEMVLLHDWLTPRLPMPEGIVPYFGKPPLHFWLTASAYRLFEIDEWTARLPSWLAAVALLVVIWSYGKRFFGEEVGVAAALIAFSSAMFFFLAGASVTDVTLAALVAGSTYSLYLFAISDASRNGLGTSSCAARTYPNCPSANELASPASASGGSGTSSAERRGRR